MNEQMDVEVRELAQLRPDALYKVEELAPLLKLHPRTLRRYCANGVFVHAVSFKGRCWRILGMDVLRLCGLLVETGDLVDE